MPPLPARLASVLLVCATAVAAQVRVVTLADGSRVMHNRGAVRPAPQPSPRPAPADLDVKGVVESNARRHRLDPKLVDAVIRVESAYDPDARSSRGAMGLMQLMPDTALELAVRDPYDPEQNIAGGTAYLRAMLDRFGGDLELSLAAYNAGPEAVRAFGGVPPYPETLGYVRKVMAAYRGEPAYRLRSAAVPTRPTYLYRDAAGHLVMSTTPPAGR